YVMTLMTWGKGYRHRLLFFSGRRRHTRFSGDWSSDVCSSDLSSDRFQHRRASQSIALHGKLLAGQGAGPWQAVFTGPTGHAAIRSEERRVGKRGRAGCRAHYKTRGWEVAR